jgi:hypothetical protein
MTEDSTSTGTYRKVLFDDGWKFLDDVGVHLVVVGPGFLGRVYVEART